MLLINEFLPNPNGSDANEWLELFNSGNSAVSLSGWHIETSSGGFGKLTTSKKTFLSGTIAPGEYKVFYKKDYKFALRNIDESITLYNTSGVLVDRAGFSGQAVSGKSYSRQGAGGYIVTDPTPGAKNIETSAIALINHPFLYNQPISSPAISTGQVVLLCIGAGVLCAGVSLYCIKNYENLSHLFFGRDEEVGEQPREEARPACPPKHGEGRESAEGTIPF